MNGIKDELLLELKSMPYTERMIEVIKAMRVISAYCRMHPTCDGCMLYKKHIGCGCRGKTPREWGI